MTKNRWISSLLCLGLLAAVGLAQSKRAVPSSTTPASQKTATTQSTAAIPGGIASLLYSWQIVPSITNYYESIHHPQPVCRKDGTQFKISIFTSYNNKVEVGEITTPTDTYQPLSQSLAGKRDDFAATSIIKSGTDSTIYLFGGTDLTNESNEVYSYDSSGFSSGPVATIPNNPTNTIVGNRSGALAVAANNKIYLFGGRRGSTVLSQVLEFDPTTNQFAILGSISTMPQALWGARGMAKAAPNGPYIYLVGGNTVAGGGMSYKVYRFNVNTKTWATIKDATQPGHPDLTLPPDMGVPMITWDPSGNVRIIAAVGGSSSGGGTWSNMQAWILNDDYSSWPNDGVAKLTASPYNDTARVRNDAGAVKCGDSTYLIGGTYGHGATLYSRSKLVDKLAEQVMKKYSDVKTH